jgi:hypothetical protein
MLNIVQFKLDTFVKAEFCPSVDLHRPRDPRLDCQSLAMPVIVEADYACLLGTWSDQAHIPS